MQKSSAFRISNLIADETSGVAVVGKNGHLTANYALATINGHNWQVCNCVPCQTLRLINMFNPMYLGNCQPVGQHTFEKNLHESTRLNGQRLNDPSLCEEKQHENVICNNNQGTKIQRIKFFILFK